MASSIKSKIYKSTAAHLKPPVLHVRPPNYAGANRTRIGSGRGASSVSSTTVSNTTVSRRDPHRTATETTALSSSISTAVFGSRIKWYPSETTAITTSTTDVSSQATDTTHDMNSTVAADRGDEYDIDEEALSQWHETSKLELPDLTGLVASSHWEALLTMWHLVMANLSLVLLAAGVVLRFFFSYLVIKRVNGLDIFSSYSRYILKADEWKTDIEFSGYVKVTGLVLIIFHSLYIICQCVYLSHAIFKSQFMLPFATIITTFVVILEISVTNIFLAPSVLSRREVVEGLQARLLKYTINSDDKFIMSYEYISIYFECCGVTDRWDFQDIHDFHLKMPGPGNTTVQVPLFVPPTCCKREIFRIDFDNPTLNKVVNCADSSTELTTKQYTVGCFNYIVELIEKGCHYYSIIAWVHVVDCAIHAALYRKGVRLMATQSIKGTELHKKLILENAEDRLNQKVTYAHKLGRPLFKAQKRLNNSSSMFN